MNLSDIQVTREAEEAGRIDLYDDYNQLDLEIEWWIKTIANIALPVFGGFGNKFLDDIFVKISCKSRINKETGWIYHIPHYMLKSHESLLDLNLVFMSSYD